MEALINNGIKQSLDKSILSSSERKRGSLFASIAEYASHDQKISEFEGVRVLGDFITPSMLTAQYKNFHTYPGGTMQHGENVGRLLEGTFDRKRSNCRSKRSTIYDKITLGWI